MLWFVLPLYFELRWNTTKTRRNEKEEKIETRKIQFATDNKVVRKYVLACVSGFNIKKR